jgi:hypothetical protein
MARHLSEIGERLVQFRVAPLDGVDEPRQIGRIGGSLGVCSWIPAVAPPVVIIEHGAVLV